MEEVGVVLRARRIIGLVLIVVGIVLITSGAYLLTYHYTQYYNVPMFFPLLPPSHQVYPYALVGLVLIILGSIILILGILLFGEIWTGKAASKPLFNPESAS